MNSLANDQTLTSTNSNINIFDERSPTQAIKNLTAYLGVCSLLVSNLIQSQDLPPSELANFRSMEQVLIQTYNIDNTTSNSIEIGSIALTTQEAQPRVMSLSETLSREAEIYANLQARKKAARLAESEYWNFLDNDED
jgi:hypothetical protein